MKGRTRWMPRDITPVRSGGYECIVRLCAGAYAIWPDKLTWDGKGFLVPFPMVVVKWRGMTRKAHHEALLVTPTAQQAQVSP